MSTVTGLPPPSRRDYRQRRDRCAAPTNEKGATMHLLERARVARGLTRAQLASSLRALGEDLGIHLGTGKDGVGRWEGTRVPDQPTQVVIARFLGIPWEVARMQPWPRWLSADPLQQPVTYRWDAPGAVAALHELSGSDVETNLNRRDFALLTGAVLSGTLMAWLTADPAAAGQLAHGRRIGEASVAHVERLVRDLRRADDTDGGGRLIQETASSRDLVVRLLQDRSYTDAHGARLHAAAADFARLHAWAQFDLYDHCDDRTFSAALHAAHASSDPALGAHVLAFWSIAAYNTERPADAEAMVTAALAVARRTSTPRVHAMLLSRRARARAHQRDTACWDDLGRSAELLDQAQGREADDPDWVYWYDQSELIGATASTHLDLGEPSRAEPAFAQAAALFPTDRVRTQALFLARQADAQYRQADIERACATANRAIDLTTEMSSHRSIAPLEDLASKMRGLAAAVPAVRDFRERLATVTA
jgi:tetratricopeptide (TPR) repeat protein